VDAEVRSRVSERQRRQLLRDDDGAQRGLIEHAAAAARVEPQRGEGARTSDPEVHLDAHARRGTRGRRPVARDLGAHHLQVVGELEVRVVDRDLARESPAHRRVRQHHALRRCGRRGLARRARVARRRLLRLGLLLHLGLRLGAILLDAHTVALVGRHRVGGLHDGCGCGGRLGRTDERHLHDVGSGQHDGASRPQHEQDREQGQMDRRRTRERAAH